jgi:hypothetical protein
MSGRTSSGFILPLSGSYWADFHPCRPKMDQPGSTQEEVIKAKYLHDYPVPISDITSLFGFSIEHGLREIWKDTTLTLSDPVERRQEDIYPGAIDFLGTYSSTDQTITIYLGSIDRFLQHKHGKGLDRDAVIEIVRIHEAIHWIHHLGYVATARAKPWEPLDPESHPDFRFERDALFTKPTDVQKFTDSRTRWFDELGKGRFNKVWEFVAEVGTCIYANYVEEVHGPRLAGKRSLRDTFWHMAQNQPPEYDILPPLKDTLQKPGSWPEMGGLFRLWLRKSWERELRLAPTEYETNYSEGGLIK